jgi:hypothetical protein
MASTFVTITAEEFQQVLAKISSGLGLGLRKDPRTVGIFHIVVVPSNHGAEDLITIKVSTTLASGGSTMGHGEASIDVGLYSPKQGRLLLGMEKSTGKGHLKRTKNWATTLESAVKSVLDKYKGADRFYLVLARYGKLETYFERAGQIIRAVPDWQKRRDLTAILEKIQRKSVLTEREEALLGEIASEGRRRQGLRE